MSEDYVPSRGQRIVMPGNLPDWPLEGQPVNPIDAYQRRLVMDGDLILKPETPEPETPEPETNAPAKKPIVPGGK